MTRLLQAFSMVVTDRRWAAPMVATGLGFGIFVGVAIGPSASGTLAGGPRLIEIVEPAEEGPEPVEEAPEAFAEAGGGGEEEGESPEALPVAAPLPPELAPAPAEAAPAPAPEPPAAEEPTEPQGTELKGTVVHTNPAAGSYTLAIDGGELVPVHARELPVPGVKLTVEARRLANGTFAEESAPEHTGKAAEAVFVGTVTRTAPDGVAPVSDPLGPQEGGTPRGYTVSGRGASLLVHVEPDPSGVVAESPAIGAYVRVTAAIEPAGDPDPAAEPAGALIQRELTVEPGEPSTYLDLAGILGQVVPDGTRLLLSADDTREGGADLALAVPPSVDATRLKPADSYLATAEVQPDGTLTLKGIASDEHRRGADDASSAQGDLQRSPDDQP